MRVVFMGTGEIALPSLDWLIEEPTVDLVGVYTQPDKPVGRKQVLTPPEAKVRAEALGIPVVQPESFKKQPEAVDQLLAMDCDIAVVMAYGQILPRAVIDAPKVACVNLHASLLPRHRGASPIQAAIRDGDSHSGITLMHIAPKLDAGDMIDTAEIELAPDETGGSLHDRLADLGPELLARGLPALMDGSAQREVQDEGLVTYSGKLGREDGELNWSRPAAELERLVRAYDPWPGTHTWLPSKDRPKKMKLFPSVQVVDGDASAAPGTLLAIDEGLKIACGEGTALLCTGDLQVEGKRRMPVSDFLKGSAVEAGMVLKGL